MSELSAFERRLAAGLDAIAGPRRTVDAIVIAQTAATQATVGRSILSRVSAVIGRDARATDQRLGRGGAGRRSGRPLVVLIAIGLMVALAVGVLVVGSGLVRQTSVVPPPAPSATLGPSATAEPTTEATPSPTLSPLGWIAFIRHIPFDGFSRDELWLIRMDGSDPHALIPGFGRHQSHPVWSPDGSRLVFSDRPAATGGGDQLYWTDLAGTAPVLVDSTCTDPCGTGDPAFSRDGARLVFERDGVGVIMDLATGQITSLGIEGGGFRWSPDHTQLVFTREAGGGRLGKDVTASRVLVANSDGTGEHGVTSADLAAGAPDWLLDGSRIVFSTREVPLQYALFGSGDIFTIRPDGTDLIALTSGGVSREPRVTEGGRIRFARNVHGAVELWEMDLDGSNAAPIDLPPVIPQPDVTTVDDVAWGPQR